MDIVEVLKTRFFENNAFHSDLQWAEVEKRFLLNPSFLEVLLRMEESLTLSGLTKRRVRQTEKKSCFSFLDSMTSIRKPH